MQKNNSIKNLIFRGAVFGFSALFVFVAGLWGLQVFAQNNTWGIFGEILNKILVKNWNEKNNDWTVKNAQTLNWLKAENFLQTKWKQQCESNQCVVGFENDGKIICK